MKRLLTRVVGGFTVGLAGITVFAWWASYKALEAGDPQRGDAGSAFWYFVFQLAAGLTIVASIICLRLWGQDWRKLAEQEAGVLCPFCGYDVRATPNRCPECGAFQAKGTQHVAPLPGRHESKVP